jgi:hypothetical protein
VLVNGGRPPSDLYINTSNLYRINIHNYLHYNLYNQADKLVLKSTFPE